MIPKVFLSSVDIFKGLANDELEQVETCCEEVNLGTETVVFKEHDPADSLFALVDGQISLRYNLPSKKETMDSKLTSINPGDSFGLSSLFKDAKYILNAYCTDKNCIALKIDRDKLNTVLENNHTIGYKVMKNLSAMVTKRFVALQNQLAKIDAQNEIDGW